jgi:hypothetical protein
MKRLLLVVMAMGLLASAFAYGQSSTIASDPHGASDRVNLPDGSAIISKCSEPGEYMSCRTYTLSAAVVKLGDDAEMAKAAKGKMSKQETADALAWSQKMSEQYEKNKH